MKEKKINFVDIMIVGIILAILIFGILRGRGDNSLEDIKTIQYTVRIKDVRDYTVNALKKQVNNSFASVYDTKTNDLIGKILSVSKSPYINYEHNNQYELVPMEVPDRYIVDITIQTQGRESENIYVDAAGTEIYVGANIEWYTKWVQTYSSQVIDVKVIDTEIIDTEPIDTEIIDKEIIDTEPIDTEIIDTEIIDTEIIDTEIIDTEPIDKEVIDTEILPEENQVH
ncbi:hypothetical protein AN639_11240 [Candidatus Epulonipiscium fishelsonii]|uniref:Uncharacterized protein n=1 Tax=Candidatus Epulonipiscium fishelsonii TaxID=77094 RepID=A0ACC8X941_9FIRM|nr:hypothetical protein AN396_10310 [Epulopiscium sp. SCG-B11WGA-EpuloA1]ONI43164.1 hypothetical protein AN639_11240 [Epulopiscium sp. SCG-B05WGA-EpuloA1]